MWRAVHVILFGTMLQHGLSSGGYKMPFGCETRFMDDQTRQGTLDLINRIRSSVALGEFEAQNFLPSSSDMTKMRWNCSLESIAERAVQNCSSSAPQATGPNGLNYYYFAPGTPEPILRNATQSAVLEWIEVKSVPWPENNVFNGNPVLRYFSNLIRSNNNAVGCSSTRCGNRASAACVFLQPDVEAGTLVYTSGSPCQTDEECSALLPGFCESGLCEITEIFSTTALPTTTPAFSSEQPETMRTTTRKANSTEPPTTTWRGTTTTQGRTWPTTTGEAMSTTKRRTWPTTTWEAMSTTKRRTWPTTTWEAMSTTKRRTWPTTTTWRRRSTTAPKRTTAWGGMCKNKAFNDAFRATALRLHNDFRSLAATGQARNGEYTSENAPPAARMNILEYDCLAEQFAHNHVRTCNKRLSSPYARPGYKENIHVLGTILTDSLSAIRNAVTTWNSELAANGIPSNMIFTPQLNRRLKKKVVRVTKVIWGTNRYVGCATQLCEGFYFTSCMYREPVNVVGQNIYTIGSVCGHCPAAQYCDPTVGLCYS